MGAMRRVTLAVMLACVAAVACSVPASAGAFSFQPIHIQRIELSAAVKEATMPSFTTDGRHLLFFDEADLWITNLTGTEVHCLSCGLPNDPKIPGAELATPFPDGKRVFFGGNHSQPGASAMAVLECLPSIVRCEHAEILPVDFSAAQPSFIPSGGALGSVQADLGGAYHATLSPDGRYVGFSDPRSDSIESMVVARLVKGLGRYEVAEAKVINPAGPTSATDRRLGAWSESAALYEFKGFSDGGADATYIESGGAGLLNPDVWSVNLATGKRTRLTYNPEWDEDNGISPNGELMSLNSTRTMHYVDWFGGLLPVRSFIDAPAAVLSAGVLGGWDQCHGPMWLLPASGDEEGTLAGEPIVDYEEPGDHVVNNIEAKSQWSLDGTMIALSTQRNGAGTFLEQGTPPYLLVAHLQGRKPAKPLKTVSSKVGSWAPSPTEYHGAIGYEGTIALPGKASGKVTAVYAGGIATMRGGTWTETYSHYSENGRDFVSGTVTVTTSASGGGSFESHLKMTGADRGNDDVAVTLGSGTISGHAESTLNGNTVRGPSPQEAVSEPCPSLLPKKPRLRARARPLGTSGRYLVKVTASVAGVGLNEAATDTRPVERAKVRFRGRTYRTDAAGTVRIKVPKGGEATVSAGDTLVPTALRLKGLRG